MEAMGSEHVYALQFSPQTVPIDVVDELCHAVWKGLLQEATGLDPRRWLKLHGAFFSIFKKRLNAFRGCGGADCLTQQVPALYHHRYAGGRAPSDPSTVVYVLETRQDAESFVRSLSDVAVRVYRASIDCSREKKQNISDRIFLAVRNTMVKYVFASSRCLGCDRRKQTPEPNIWRDTDWMA